MARLVGGPQPLRVPCTQDGTPYSLAGEMHWSDWLDTPTRQFNTIWAIPISAFGIEIQMPEGVTVPICRNSMDKKYYLVTFDADYLKERFYREWIKPLCWTQSTVKQFFSLNEQWIDERIKYFRKNEIREQAEQLSVVDRKGRDADYWFEVLMDMEEAEQQNESKTIKHAKENYPLTGTLERLGNEYFLLTATKERYKVEPDKLEGYALPDGLITDLVGMQFLFGVDPEKNPPRLRNTKGWVKELVME